MTYPLDGERVTRTLRNIEFGTGRPRDEPAPPELAELFRANKTAQLLLEASADAWEAKRTRATFDGYIRCIDRWERRYNDLLRALGKHRDHCYVADGFRFWLHTEPDGCRRSYVRIEEAKP